MNNKNKVILFTSNGFSIVESLIAMFLLVSVGLTISYFNMHRQSQVMTKEYNSCQQHASATIDKIRSLGVAKFIAPVNQATNEVVAPTNDQGRLQYVSVQDEWFAKNEPLFTKNNTAGAVVLRNHRAIVGYMSLLNALYENNREFCTNANGFSYEGGTRVLLENGDQEHLKNARSTIRIQPYDLKTGNVLGCTYPLVAMPSSFTAGLTGAQTPASSRSIVATEAGARPDVGFLVTAFTRFDDLNGQEGSCSSSANFNYPNVSFGAARLGKPGAIMSGQILSSSSSSIESTHTFSSCDSAMPLRELMIDTDIIDYDTKKGIVMMCRDASTFLPHSTNVNCVGRVNLTDDFTSTINRGWVPCDQVTICGRPVSRVNKSANGLRVIYQNVNIGCRGRVDIQIVDAAQNTSDSHFEELKGAPPRNYCTNDCTKVGLLNKPGTMGWCPGGGRTVANSCDPPPPPPPPPSSDGDGTPDGGDSDGKGGDGGNRG